MFAFCGQLLFAMLALALAVSADGSSGAADKGTDSLLGVADTNVPSATVPEVEDGIEEGQRTLPEAALMMEPESEEGVEEEGEEGEVFTSPVSHYRFPLIQYLRNEWFVCVCVCVCVCGGGGGYEGGYFDVRLQCMYTSLGASGRLFAG
jgi:hypothetical protein